MGDVIERIKIPLFEEQSRNVAEAIKHGQLVTGPHLRALEARLTRLFGKRHVVLTANGFSALFLALKSAAPRRQRVLTSPVSTCFAIVNAIKAAGHDVSYADMDTASAGLPKLDQGDGDAIAVVPDHFGKISPACKRWVSGRGLLIEDAAQSFISRSRIETAADVAVLSFFPTKLVNGIDGGAILTDDAGIYARAKNLCSYADQLSYEEGPPRYNLRMNNVNAAFALGTLAHLRGVTAAMRSSFKALSAVLTKRGIEHLRMSDAEVPSRLIVFAHDARQKGRLTRKLAQAGVPGCSELIHVCPKALIPRFPKARGLVERTFSIPLHPALSVKDLSTIEAAIGRL